MSFNIKIAKQGEEKQIVLNEQTKDQVLEAFNKIPWETLVNELNEYSLEHNEVSFGIDDSVNGIGIIVAPSSASEWILYYKKPIEKKGVFAKLSSNRFEILEGKGLSMETAKQCVIAMLDSDYTFIRKLAQKNTGFKTK